ncbi:glycosyltransferase [Pseudomonas cichorii]|uniref:glycosyltransferase n=1 Tax=Pseudomonas cichorii TaxID=36746 RepID=UPI000EFE6769|nr:glycosyltransferase [Pseudomonas cichorii]
MHIADMTMLYAPASGGVRTYLDAKHSRLAHYPDVRHSLLIPGACSSHNDGIYKVAAPTLPFSNGYRFPLRVSPWRNALQSLQPDLIEVGDAYLTAWAAIEARRQLAVPIIGFYHSDLPLLVSNRMGHWMGTSVETYISKLYGNFDRVLAPSQVMADKLIAMGVENVYTQPLGVDLLTFDPRHRNPNIRIELGLQQHTHLLIFAGRGSKEKKLPVLLECMKKLGPDYHLLLVGSHMPSQVPDNVSVIGHFCKTALLAQLLASADALLHAGDQETFGLVILEAMASGIPVVAVAAGAFTEIVQPECGLLCQANNPQAMANSVRELFRGDSKQKGRAARRYVEEHYSWDKVISGLLEHYQAVLGCRLPALAHG